MKRLLISTAAVALMATPGLAADLPVYEPPPAMIAPTPMASNWSGFYIGVHGGYGWADADVDDDFDFDLDGDDDFFGDAALDGPVIGGQVGVNWQFNSFVLGLEGDGSWSGIDNDEDTFSDAGDIGINAEVDWLASARGRVGLAFDRFMVYGTGGVAFAEFSTDIEDASGIFDDVDDDGETEVGWVAGGGAEFLATDNVSLGVEYLHYSFDDVDAPAFAAAAGPTFTTEGDVDVDVIRGRVNVKFGSLFGG